MLHSQSRPQRRRSNVNDIPDEPGFELRVAIVALHDVWEALDDGTFGSDRRRYTGGALARGLYGDAAVELKALIAARAVLARREFERLEEGLHRAEKQLGAFSVLVREGVVGHRTTLNRFR